MVPSPRCPPVNQARELAQANEAKNTITIYERASQLELISRLSSAYAISSPRRRRCWIGSVYKKESIFPGNVYRDVLIYRSGYHLTRLDRCLRNCGSPPNASSPNKANRIDYADPASLRFLFWRCFVRTTLL
ncbi:MAG: hypothetical protein R2912_11300 [Eubacteriales bacterium]